MRALTRIREKYRNGTLGLYARDQLARAGLDIRVFYWVEEFPPDAANRPVAPLEDLEFTRFTEDDFRSMKLDTGDRSAEQAIYSQARLSQEGMACYGLKSGEEVVAFSWVNSSECHIDIFRKKLSPGQAYLYDMYTLKQFRGKGIAPYLRMILMQELSSLGYQQFFSISEYYNKPAIRFKQKMNARFRSLHLAVTFFGRQLFSIRLKTLP